MAMPPGIQEDSFEAHHQRRNRAWEQGAAPAISIVMIGHRRADLLARAIESLERHCASGDWELVLIRNGASPEVAQLASSLLAAERFPFSVVSIPEHRPGAARNFGLRAARAPLLFFLDDDIECFQDVVSAAIEIFSREDVMAAGGANLTPPVSGALERATGGVMASRLGAASMRRRYRPGPEGPDTEHGLILCNLAVKREVFESERGFATHLVSNEENVLLQRLEEKGGKLWSSPRLAVHHRRRDTWSGLCSQAFKYGGGRAQNILLVPESLRALYFLPLFLLLYLAFLPSLALSFGGAAFLPLGLYLALGLFHAFFQTLRQRDPAHLLAPVVFPCIHLAYGLGFARALLIWGIRRKKLREHAV